METEERKRRAKITGMKVQRGRGNKRSEAGHRSASDKEGAEKRNR